MAIVENDLIGSACHLYHSEGIDQPVRVLINGLRDGDLMPSYFFREQKAMNALERGALAQAHGKILDIGAGAGCHADILQHRGRNVFALEKSPLLCEIMTSRGIRQVVCSDLWQHEDEGFDTILLLMNGFGLAGSDGNLTKFIGHLASMLAPGGSIIGDSTDIAYFYHDRGRLPASGPDGSYFGNVTFQLRWQGHTQTFPWLFADEGLIAETCRTLGLRFSVIRRGRDHHFLCRISKS